MVYIINNYDGSQLVGINDQTVNSTATSLRLPGRDYKPYGEVIVENLVWMLQNFSGSTPPLRAVQGQIWYDSTAKVLRVYDNTDWLTVNKALVGNQLPATGQDGEVFYHTTKKQMFLWDVTTWKLIAPMGASDGTDPAPAAQINHTQWEALKVPNTGEAILKVSVGGVCVAIMSALEFTTAVGAIPGFTPVNIKPGINLNTTMKLHGTATLADVATSTLSLGGVLAANYMRRDQNNVPTTSGLSLGSPSSPYLSMHADNFVGNASSATLATNATQLNGQSASYYLDATNMNAGTLNVARLPFTPVNKAGDTMLGTLTLNADPTLDLHAATKQYVDSLVFTYGRLQTGWTTDNVFDVYPPVGKLMANLLAFIPSIAYIYFAGDVNFDDTLTCDFTILSDRIQVTLLNTEQRLTPSAHFLAIWR